MSNYPIEKSYYNLLLRNYPQYEILRQELLKLFYRKALDNGITVDCFVNLNSYLSSLYKRNEYVYDEPMSIASSIVNFAAHIREFFATRFSIVSRIFLVYGNTTPNSAIQFVNEYNAHNEMDRLVKPNINHQIDENLNLLNILIPYIPGVYYIEDRSTEPAVIIRELIKYEFSNKGNSNTRFIFSKDLYDYQLVSTVPKTHLIRVKKTMNGDQTYTVSYFDFYKKLSKTLSLKNLIGDGVSPELYSLYMAFAGCKDRNIKSITNYPNTDKKIHSLIDTGIIFNGYNPSIALDSDFATKFNTIDIVQKRLCALDLIYQSHIYTMSPSYNNLTKNLVDLYDPDSVRQINNEYFHKYPLDLNVF